MINLARKEKKANPIKKSLSLSIGLAWTGGITPNLDSTVVACLLRVLNNSKVKSFMKNFAAECVLHPPQAPKYIRAQMSSSWKILEYSDIRQGCAIICILWPIHSLHDSSSSFHKIRTQSFQPWFPIRLMRLNLDLMVIPITCSLHHFLRMTLAQNPNKLAG